MKKSMLLLLGVGLLITSCKNDKKGDEPTGQPQTETVNKEKQEVVKFEEGALTYTMSMSDPIFNDFVKYVSKDPLHMLDLAKEYGAKLSKEDNAHLQEVIKNSPSFTTTYGTLPFISSSVYVAGYEAVYKGEGLTYVLENKWNDILDEGFAYVGSTIVPNSKLNFSYKKNYIDAEQLQTNIDTLNYDRVATGDFIDLVGYKAERIVYTAKEAMAVGQRFLPKELTVYVSESFNPAINKVLPFNVNEEHGVLKIVTKFLDTDDLYVTYEVSTAVKRKVLDTETSISMTNNTYDVKGDRDILALGMRLTKIIAIPRL
ncbi:hypothetical protein [Myroides phaeus]|uniref:Uncharacterized protein n=1 Tax=Myroides phaeus TaxID=702745 RepID=A0A1G8DKM4_9FLAO|nr:hypothetical protein [Myroides phaeus]MEC4117117.1 hypothetical protein [Myroides phaeus]SDH57930.1 hypothetical protein SAMN05421818_10758 [Myroides phaeus]